MPEIIELRNVSYEVQNKSLVRDLSCIFEEGKTTALIGPSGCGKSTALKLAAGIYIPSEGNVLFKGKDITRMNRTENLGFRRVSAMVFQDSALWANQNLYQNLELPLRVHFPSMNKKDREKRIEAVVAEAGYKRDLMIRPAELSMGEQKLLGFARALICGPRLLYLDEWTESLDESAAHRLIGIFKKMKNDGVTMILISHDIRILNELVDTVVMLNSGQITSHLTREQFLGNETLMRSIEKGMES